MNSLSVKKTRVCECTDAAFITADTVKLEFFWPGPAPRAGQFFLIKPRRTGVFLARPISVAGWKQTFSTENADNQYVYNEGILRFLVAMRGRGSR